MPLPRPIAVPIKWLGSRGGWFLTAALVIVVGIWGLIALTDSVREGHTQKFDDRINTWCVTHPGPKWLQESGRDLTALGGFTVLSLGVAAVAGYLLLSGKKGMTMLVIAASVGGVVLTTCLKHWIDRPRPALRQAGTLVFTRSFPSGHSALSAAVYLTLGALLARASTSRVLKFYYLCIALTLTTLVGLSRIYLGAHYPTDVLAGWTIGLVWSLLCWMVARELQRRRVVEPESNGKAELEDV